MDVIINGQSYGLKFTYRALTAIAKYLGFSKISETKEMIQSIGLDNVPNLISIVITENLRKEGIKGNTPSSDQILDAMDDNPAVFGDFVEAFSDAYTALFPEVEDQAEKIEKGE